MDLKEKTTTKKAAFSCADIQRVKICVLPKKKQKKTDTNERFVSFLLCLAFCESFLFFL